MKIRPSYKYLDYDTYKQYLESDDWLNKKAKIMKKYPNSRYCWVCDSQKRLDLHHENYNTIPFEVFLRDVFWLCSLCHAMVHISNTGERINLLESGYQEQLQQRRLQLRKEYVFAYIRPTTIIPFLRTWFYRQKY